MEMVSIQRIQVPLVLPPCFPSVAPAAMLGQSNSAIYRLVRQAHPVPSEETPSRDIARQRHTRTQLRVSRSVGYEINDLLEI
jgi:hypothetical protein